MKGLHRVLDGTVSDYYVVIGEGYLADTSYVQILVSIVAPKYSSDGETVMVYYKEPKLGMVHSTDKALFSITHLRYGLEYIKDVSDIKYYSRGVISKYVKSDKSVKQDYPSWKYSETLIDDVMEVSNSIGLIST